jgi:hypothetical protein
VSCKELTAIYKFEVHDMKNINENMVFLTTNLDKETLKQIYGFVAHTIPVTNRDHYYSLKIDVVKGKLYEMDKTVRIQIMRETEGVS